MNITTKTINPAFGTFIAAITFTGVVAVAPPATATTWVPVPEPDTTTQAIAFDIGLWVAERKTRIAQDWIERARNEAAAVHPDDHDMGDLVTQAKSRAAQAYIDRAVPPE